GHIVHKVGCLYALVLPNNGRLVLRHIRGCGLELLPNLLIAYKTNNAIFKLHTENNETDIVS
ncbi:9049_t:CDS:1, partial [Rhizophagus irregularis]